MKNFLLKLKTLFIKETKSKEYYENLLHESHESHQRTGKLDYKKIHEAVKGLQVEHNYSLTQILAIGAKPAPQKYSKDENNDNVLNLH